MSKLGEQPQEGEERDAVHVAVMPAVAGQSLRPGDKVSLGDDGLAYKVGGEHVGVVDPFLKDPILWGERFWLLVVPNTVSSLRHDWDHPKLPRRLAPNMAAPWVSQHWLEQFAENLHYEYEEVLGFAKRHAEGGDPGVDLEIPPEFWSHFEVVTGIRVENRVTRFENTECRSC